MFVQIKPILLFNIIVILQSLFGNEFYLQSQSLVDQLSVGNGSDTQRGAETGTGKGVGTIENNGSLSLLLSPCHEFVQSIA